MWVWFTVLVPYSCLPSLRGINLLHSCPSRYPLFIKLTSLHALIAVIFSWWRLSWLSGSLFVWSLCVSLSLCVCVQACIHVHVCTCVWVVYTRVCTSEHRYVYVKSQEKGMWCSSLSFSAFFPSGKLCKWRWLPASLRNPPALVFLLHYWDSRCCGHAHLFVWLLDIWPQVLMQCFLCLIKEKSPQLKLYFI